ncbi:hypothetical protein GQ44DRAFT_754534 [Phaeosphaeriaceae sp. PMI808]|nr:hypothetical protein GQ44DRAFT_754534 [Phaeosphaeriaceae sp. PMI808]
MDMIYSYDIGSHDIFSVSSSIRMNRDHVLHGYLTPKAQSVGSRRRPTVDLRDQLFSLSKVSRQLYDEIKLLPFKLNTSNIYADFFYLLKDKRVFTITTISSGPGSMPMLSHSNLTQTQKKD